MRAIRWGLAFVLSVAMALAGTPATAGPIVWERRVAFSVEAVATDPDGDLYLVGFAPSGEERYFGTPWAMVLAKVAPDGDRLWTRTWRSHHRFYVQALGTDVAVSSDGRDVYVVGRAVNDTGEASKPRVWVYAGDGALRWTRPSPGGTAVAAVPGGFVTAGADRIVRWDRDGTERWDRPFLDVTGDVCKVVHDVAVGGGAIYAVGFLDRTPTCNDSEGGPIPEDAEIVIQKRAPGGSVLWSKVRTDAGRDNDEAVTVDAAGRRIFVAGEVHGRGWLARFTPGGRRVWIHRWRRETPTDVTAAPWGRVYLLSDRRAAVTTLRSFSLSGELRSGIRVRLDRANWDASGVATTRGGAIYATARLFAARGWLWRMSR
jgi:hypothetical protein